MREPHEWAVRKDIAARRLHGMLGRMFRASVVRDAADGSGLARYFDVGRRLQRGEWSERRGEWQRCWPMLRMTGGGGVCGEKCSRLRHNTAWEVRQCKCSHAPTTCSPAHKRHSRASGFSTAGAPQSQDPYGLAPHLAERQAVAGGVCGLKRHVRVLDKQKGSLEDDATMDVP